MEIRRDVFQAIADPTRRAIITLVALQAMTPSAIAENFDSSRQTISKHIQILTECKLLDQKQSGREIYYHINAKNVPLNVGNKVCGRIFFNVQILPIWWDLKYFQPVTKAYKCTNS